MARVLALGGVFFKSADPKAMRSWYGEALGLPVDAWGASLKFAGLPEGTFAQWSPHATDTTTFGSGDQAYMFNLIVDDVEAALARVKANGGTPIGAVQALKYGTFGWFQDPEGRKVELVGVPGALAVGGIFFKSDDPAALCAWYGEALGMPVDDHGAMLPMAGQHPAAYCQWAPFKADTTYFGAPDQAYMFNLIVDDVRAVLEHVSAKGGTPVGEVQDLEYGTFGWFVDPEGRKVELWTPAG
jgi:predicted enzyme related to lactoylglutathione lyase